ncbi:MAG: flippase [Bacteroidia bacterium]
MFKQIEKKLKRQFKDKSFTELATGSATSFVMRMVGLVVNYVFTFMISRFYGATILGALTISQTVLSMFTIFSRLGMDTSAVKLFSANIALNKWSNVLNIYKKILEISLPIGIVTTLALFFGADWVAGTMFHKPHLAYEFRLISFAIIPMSIRFINSESYRGFKELRLYNWSRNVSYYLYACVILGVLTLFLGHGIPVEYAKYLPNFSFTLSLAILAISSTFLVFKYIKARTQVETDEYSKRDIVKTSVPMMLSSSLILISGWINTLFLAKYCSEGDVGIYRVIVQVTTVCGFILLSVNSVAAPKFAELFALGDIDGLGKAARQTSKINFLASIPIFLGIIIFRKFIMSIFGKQFEIGANILLLNMVGQFFNIFSGSVGSFLNMTGHHRAFQNILIVATLLNVFACYIFIPMYGIMGSAISSMIFMSSWNIISLVYIQVKFKIKTYYWPF